ncbi:putative PIN and TRAM-domain containing protein precursor [Lacunisphaera limnophila]|uniref:Putative PIN and TRAM-domain containing protein n=1 Tax=Lacunisphaera limnophila TaxID=1838286 RepID=A0A1D8AWT1_9BACT|nr:PIN domain-containing protein [Lacunisphaera limnophila]AOS45340.1 putative PIN and TRAM-domain containing protein precursor [Lacunisphaera limnophila]
MNKTLLVIRLLFIFLCIAASWLVCYSIKEWDDHRGLAMVIGLMIGLLVVLIDVMLKGFSLRGLTALTFGLAMGTLISWMIGSSPLLQEGDPQVIYLVQLALFVICTYLGTVIALRGKDDFNLVIPYVRFVPHEVDVPLVVVDTSALVDGRIAKVCETRFLAAGLIIPSFVLTELQGIADSPDPVKQARGRRGLQVLNDLRALKHVDIRIHQSEVSRRQDIEAKLVFLAQSMRAKLLTTDTNLASMARFQGVEWLNLHALETALRPELVIGESIAVELVRPGKDEGQALGFLGDGSMVVVNNARAFVGKRVTAEIIGVLPSGSGKMVFATLLGEDVPV